MDKIRNTSSSSSSNKKAKDRSCHSVMDSFQSQLKVSANSLFKNLELNLAQESLSQLNNQLMFAKAEKYEGSIWVLQA